MVDDAAPQSSACGLHQPYAAVPHRVISVPQQPDAPRTVICSEAVEQHRMDTMVEAAALLGFLSAGIFVAHAVEAYRAN